MYSRTYAPQYDIRGVITFQNGFVKLQKIEKVWAFSSFEGNVHY